MGTNFYHHTAICECCGRRDIRHIGKSMVTFQGYRPEPWDGGDKTDIQSWEDWKVALRAGGEVHNEYGEVIAVEEFICDVESTSLEARSRQFRWMESRQPSSVVGPTPHTWLDPAGFSFSTQDFS